MDLRTKIDRVTEEITASRAENFINIVISDEPDKEICNLIFNNESWSVLPNKTDIFDVLVFAKLFPSKGQAKNNWNKTDRFIETGISSFLVGKKKFGVHIFKSAIEFKDEN